MKYENNTVEAAHALAMTGAVEAQVGDPTGYGKVWQALVVLDRVALLRNNVDDRHYKHVKPGHTTLMWLVLDDDTVICHESTDCDQKGHAEKMQALRESFEQVTQHYDDPVPVEDIVLDQHTASYEFDFDYEWKEEVDDGQTHA